MKKLLADRNFLLLLGGQTLTMFGDVALFLVLAIWVKELTGSSGAAGAVFLALTIPALLAPFGGVLVDRFPRRRVMIVNDLVTGLGVLALLLVQGPSDVWIIYAVAVFYGVSQQIFFAARSGLLFSMLEGDQLAEANGILESLRQGLRVLGPVTGAALYSAFGGGATALLDSITFVISAGCLALMRVPDLEARSPETSFTTELLGGARHVLRTPEIRRVVGVFAIALSVVGFLEPALFTLMERLGRPPTFVGVIGMVQGIGSVIGGLAGGRLLSRYREVPLIGAGSAVCGFGLFFVATLALGPVIAATVVIGIAFAILMVAYATLLQRRTPDELQGRVFAATEMVVTIPYAASIGIGAWLVSFVDVRVLYVLSAIGLLAAGAALLVWRIPEPVELPTADEVEGAKEEGATMPQGIVPPA